MIHDAGDDVFAEIIAAHNISVALLIVSTPPTPCGTGSSLLFLLAIVSYSLKVNHLNSYGSQSACRVEVQQAEGSSERQ